jgi:16S rRNA (cytidine1402-2'-O)-methyltransferase
MKNEKGSLILVPTPLDESQALPLSVVEKLKIACDNPGDFIIAIEEPKATRGRWLRWGLPREAFENWVVFNEQTQDDLCPQLMDQIRAGKSVYLLSDMGLPGFCDPGQPLINACHKHHYKVTSEYFPNSVALAVALSGFAMKSFYFEGFLPQKTEERAERWTSLLTKNSSIVFMDTPYRLSLCLDDVIKYSAKTNTRFELFLGISLQTPSELLLRGDPKKIAEKIKTLENKKQPFIGILFKTVQ